MKEELIKIFTARIKAEHRKHFRIDWEKLAAHKIYSEMISYAACTFCKGEGFILEHDYEALCNKCQGDKIDINKLL